MANTLKLLNKAEINDFLEQCAKRAGAYAVKGLAPEGATYADGESITKPINIAWRCAETGQRVECVYALGDE